MQMGQKLESTEFYRVLKYPECKSRLLINMKHKQLHSIGHNYADSLASGLGFVVGHCEANVFADAASSPDCHLTVDFLNGNLLNGTASKQLLSAIPIFQNEFDNFCQKHGTTRCDFEEFTVRFEAGRRSKRYFVTVADKRGRRSTIEYIGVPGRRIKMLDHLGRVVPNKATS